MLFSSFSFNTAKTGKIVTEDGSDRLAVLKESGESYSSNIISYAIILICFALPKVFQIVSVTTTTLLGRRLAILEAGMDSRTSEGWMKNNTCYIFHFNNQFPFHHNLSTRWFAQFPCNYDLRMFPFDQQNCELEFKMRNAIKAQVLCSY